jgi:IS30 family transposase
MHAHSNKSGQLSQGERYQIEILFKNGKWRSCRCIGQELNRDHTVISRELQRNWVTNAWGVVVRYSAKEAEEKRLIRRGNANNGHVKLLRNPGMLKCFEKVFMEKYDSQWVDEIIGFLRLEWIEMVCTSTMYRFIHTYKREWEYKLRHGKHWYKKRKGKSKKTALVGVPLITERPEEVNNRENFGDWEVDMVVWPLWEKWGLLTLVERKTRFTIITKLNDAKKVSVYMAMLNALSVYKVNSITSDNWSEFAGMKRIGEVLWCEVFRCNPYSSREKGSNERNNGIIRWFCPKWLSIQQYSEEYIREIERKINDKPRKILWYKTAWMALKSHSSREI